jgi:hypothetical protein
MLFIGLGGYDNAASDVFLRHHRGVLLHGGLVFFHPSRAGFQLRSSFFVVRCLIDFVFNKRLEKLKFEVITVPSFISFPPGCLFLFGQLAHLRHAHQQAHSTLVEGDS